MQAETDTTTEPAPIIAHLDDINRETANRAYSGTSFSPEKRGESCRADYVEHVNGLYAQLWPTAKSERQKQILADEMERYRLAYVKKYSACLASRSGVVSTMIAGPANFPVRRMEKKNAAADRKLNEFIEWKGKAITSIRKKIAEAADASDKLESAWAPVRDRIKRSLSTIEGIDERGEHSTRSLIVGNMTGRIECLASNGETELVRRALQLLTEYNAKHKKPCVTAANKVWKLTEAAVASVQAHDARIDRGIEVIGEAPGIEAYANYENDRVQLMFTTKPDDKTRELLKRSGWRWAPSEGAWQRQLTNAGIASGKAILEKLQAVEPTAPTTSTTEPSDLQQQVTMARQKHPGMMILMQQGDRIEMYGADAEGGRIYLGLTPERRNGTTVVSFPLDHLDSILRKLLGFSKRVAIVEPVEETAKAGVA